MAIRRTGRLAQLYILQLQDSGLPLGRRPGGDGGRDWTRLDASGAITVSRETLSRNRNCKSQLSRTALQAQVPQSWTPEMG